MRWDTWSGMLGAANNRASHAMNSRRIAVNVFQKTSFIHGRIPPSRVHGKKKIKKV